MLGSSILGSRTLGSALTYGLQISPVGIPSAEAFGTSAILTSLSGDDVYGNLVYGDIGFQDVVPSVGIYIYVSGISSAEAFGNAKLDLNILAGGIASAEAFGTPVVNVYGIQNITAAGNIASAEAFGSPYVTVASMGNFDWIPYLIVRISSDVYVCRVGGLKGNA